MDKGGSIFAPFFITRCLEEGDELYQRLLSETWNGFVIGDRLKTFYAGAGKAEKRVLQNAANASPHVVIMVVEEKEDMAERVGIVEFDNPGHRADFRRVPKLTRTLRLG
jgi:hypothetical protein